MPFTATSAPNQESHPSLFLHRIYTLHTTLCLRFSLSGLSSSSVSHLRCNRGNPRIQLPHLARRRFSSLPSPLPRTRERLNRKVVSISENYRMPKERRDHSMSIEGCRASPFSSSSSQSRQSATKISEGSDEDLMQWEEARCPVCMEHPHNAILLICSSHDKGCRPYMCDTSYRHSNCFDQFRKSSAETSSAVPQSEETASPTTPLALAVASDTTDSDVQEERSEDGQIHVEAASCEELAKPKLLCPLCRGAVTRWIVVDKARRFMNAKTRSCACEMCDFSGTYADLRKHARVEHPLVRPCEADPERERSWRRLERQRDLGDLISSLQSPFGEDRTEDNILHIDEGSWLTVYLLIRVFRPGSSSRGRSWSGASRARVGIRRRPSSHWGESLDGDGAPPTREEDNDSCEEEATVTFRRRTRRRTTQDDEQG